MLLLRISYIVTGSSSNNILNLIQISASWSMYMVKLCHEKMLILRCILPPKKIEPRPEKN